MKVKRNYIAIVLDKSGSMGVIRKPIIKAFNGKVAAICRSGHGIDTKLIKTEFNSIVDVKFWNDKPENLPPLTIRDYRTGGATALYEAIGQSIETLEGLLESNDEGTTFLVIIVSDGQNNCDRKWTESDIKEKMEELNQTGRWTFMFVGANQDLAVMSEKLNIPPGNMLGFEPNERSVNNMDNMTQAGIESYRENLTRGIRRSENTYSDNGTIARTE